MTNQYHMENLGNNRFLAHKQSSERIIDLSHFQLLHTGVDTIKQLYKGTIDTKFYEEIVMTEKTRVINGEVFAFGGGGNSSYRHRFQNSELGVIIFFASAYIAPHEDFSIAAGSHLKIELSPHFIISRTADEIQSYLDDIAAFFLTEFSPTGCAIHLCADFVGFTGEDFCQFELTTRSRRCSICSHTDFSTLDFDGALDAVFSQYGKESFTYGLINNYQMCFYNKSQEVFRKGKQDFWHSVWASNGAIFSNDASCHKNEVHRLEFRLHQKVVNQFSTMNEQLIDYKTVSKHLSGIWQHSLEKFRLNYSTHYVHPVWTILREVFPNSGNGLKVYKRNYVKQVTQSIERNYSMVLGNLSKISVFLGDSFHEFRERLQGCGLFKHFDSVFKSKKRTLDEYYYDKTILYRTMQGICV